MKLTFHTGGHLKELFAHRREPEAARSLLHMYWGTLLALAPVLLSFVGLFSWWEMSLGVDGPSISAISGGIEAQTQKQLHVFIQDYSERQENYDAARASTPTVSDPYIEVRRSLETQSNIPSGDLFPPLPSKGLR